MKIGYDACLRIIFIIYGCFSFLFFILEHYNNIVNHSLSLKVKTLIFEPGILQENAYCMYVVINSFYQIRRKNGKIPSYTLYCITLKYFRVIYKKFKYLLKYLRESSGNQCSVIKIGMKFKSLYLKYYTISCNVFHFHKKNTHKNLYYVKHFTNVLRSFIFIILFIRKPKERW